MHAWHQLVFPLEGGLALALERQRQQLDPLHGALVHLGAWHTFSGVGRNCVLVLDAPAALVEQTAPRLLERSALQIDEVFGPLLRAAAARLAEGVPPPAVTRSWASLLLFTAAERQQPGPARLPERLRLALAFIDARALRPIGVSDVARAAGLGPSQLHHLFRRVLDTTPHEAIMARRVEAARGWLERSDLPIAEVALRAGFADQQSLGKALRRRLGCTPGQLRRRARHTRTGPAAGG
jgi:AraC-like DNA-binding protein